MHRPGRRRVLPLLVPLVAVTACATVTGAGRDTDGSVRRADAAVEVTLEHLEASDAWSVTYRFPEPVQAARFIRSGYELRTSMWRVVRPAGVTLRREGEEVLLRARDGRPFREVVIELPTYLRGSSADYSLFSRFSDGSVLVYTGHFDVEPCPEPGRCGGPSGVDEPIRPNRFVLLPRRAERIVLLGRVHEGSTRWEGDEDGTWAYFGGLTPVEAERFVAVLDPGVPRWLVEQVHTLLPRLFELYASRTGQPLGFRPVVFLNLVEGSTPISWGISGGTRPGLVHLSVELGRRLQQEADPAMAERVAYLLAHEAAHLWNRQAFTHDVEDGDWLHEGGADAFAFRALLHFGFIGPERFLERLSESLSTCLLGLADRPLRESPRPERYQNHYHCGATIALWTEAAVGRAHPGKDLFSFWAELLSRSDGRRYDDQLYYRELERLGGRSAAEGVRRLVEGPAEGVGSSVVDALRGLGLDIEAAGQGALPRRYQELAGRWAVGVVLAQDCGSDHRIIRVDRAYELAEAGGCARLRVGDRIGALGPHEVIVDGAAAYDLVVARCARGEPVELAGSASGPRVGIPCRIRVAPRPPYLLVTGWAGATGGPRRAEPIR